MVRVNRGVRGKRQRLQSSLNPGGFNTKEWRNTTPRRDAVPSHVPFKWIGNSFKTTCPFLFPRSLLISSRHQHQIKKTQKTLLITSTKTSSSILQIVVTTGIQNKLFQAQYVIFSPPRQTSDCTDIYKSKNERDKHSASLQLFSPPKHRCKEVFKSTSL